MKSKLYGEQTLYTFRVLQLGGTWCDIISMLLHKHCRRVKSWHDPTVKAEQWTPFHVVKSSNRTLMTGKVLFSHYKQNERREYTNCEKARHELWNKVRQNYTRLSLVSGTVRGEESRCLLSLVTCSHFLISRLSWTRLRLRNKGPANKASHGELTAALVAIYIQMHWQEFA